MTHNLRQSHIKFIVVRHAESNSNKARLFEASGSHSGSPLTEYGEIQARLLAMHLSDLFSVARIYSSPTKRTLDTAALLKEKLNSPITIIDELSEIDCGEWGDKPIDTIKKENTNQWKMRKEKPTEFCFPQGESLLDVQNRVIPFIDGLLKTTRQQIIVLVSHSTMISVILAYLHNWQLEEAWLDKRSYHINTAFTVLEIEENRAKVISSDISSTAHLIDKR